MRLITKPVPWSNYSLENILSRKDIFDASTYKDYRSNHLPRFFFTPYDRESYRTHLKIWSDQLLLKTVKGIQDGRFRLFSHLEVHTNFPPDWHCNYISNFRYPSDKHWSGISDFRGGDIKCVWEISRFGFVYDLVRAYWRTNNEKYPELFWILIEDWMANNGPNLGVNWKCGQETTFRVMAWCWGLYGFRDSAITTPERIALLAKMIFLSGSRIERNIGYAISQKNNHSISEAVGLWTIGILFPELKYSQRWRRKGKKLIEELVVDLINGEGVFTQNSVNYHRLVLHVLLWSFRLAELNGEPFDKSAIDRFRKSAELLYQLQDDRTGQLPDYGTNDGALILPLSNCDYRDFRPILQASFYFLDRVRIFEEGPWDEDLLWLFGPDALKAPVRKKDKIDLQSNKSGYYTIRSEDGFLFTRCGRHIFRPGQADMLHIDIWWKGYNIAIDPGSYSYNAPPPWDEGLGRTAYHNTVIVDGLDQMDRYGKFLSFPWVEGEVYLNQKNLAKGYRYFEGSHNGYHRLRDPVQYRRGILRFDDDNWIILDKLHGKNLHTYRLQWLFSNFPHQFDKTKQKLTLYPEDNVYRVHYGSIQNAFDISLVSADEHSPRGWWSPYYYYKESAISLELIVKDTLTNFYTVLGPDIINVRLEHNTLTVQCKHREYTIELNPGINYAPIVTNIDRKLMAISK